MSKLSFLLVFFLNPFFATIKALRTLNEKLIVLAVTLFMGFFGTTTFFYGDNYRYVENFLIMHRQIMSWDNFTNTLYNGDTSLDIAIPSISYFVSIFTGNEKVLFAIFGLIYGYFFSKNIIISLKISQYKESKSKLILFFLIIFSFIYPFWTGTNAVRFVIAFNIFIYFLYKYIENKKFKDFIFMCISVLFHFSFMTAILITVLYFFSNVKKRENFLILFFIFSFLLTEIAFEPLKNFALNYAPGFLQTKVEGYTSDTFIESMEDLQSEKTWHAMIYIEVFKITICILMLYICYYRKLLTEDLMFKKIFPITLFYFSIFNILSVLPDMDRFLRIAYMLAIFCILIFITHRKRLMIFKFAFIPLTFWLIVMLRGGFDFVTVGTIVSNPVLAWYGFLDDVNLIMFIK